MIKKLFLLVTFSVLSIISYSQLEVLQKPKANPGTYQIILHTDKMEYAFTDEFLMYIEEKRDETKDVTINLNMFVDVFIPSKESIDSKDFIPLTEYLHN
jgi:hypothetical protein